MFQSQYDHPSGCMYILTSQRSLLLQQHPVLLPVALLCGSIGMYFASLFASSLFPVLAITGAPAELICQLIALVLAVTGILTGIISIIENFDRISKRTGLYSKLKEGA